MNNESTDGRISDAAAKAANALSNVRERLPDAESLRRGLKNPIGIIVGAAAAGFLLGLIPPVSDYERDKLRPLADELVEHASDARDEIFEHGRSALAETATAAQETLEQHAREIASSLGAGTFETLSAP
jgi:hypothetical protein